MFWLPATHNSTIISISFTNHVFCRNSQHACDFPVRQWSSGLRLNSLSWHVHCSGRKTFWTTNISTSSLSVCVDRPARPLCTPAAWSGGPCTAVWWWSRPEQRCCGATESCPWETQTHTKKLLLWFQQMLWVGIPALLAKSLTSLVRCETHSALTLASVVLPKFSGLSPVGKNATGQARMFRLETHSCCLQDEAVVELQSRDFPHCSMKLESWTSETSH